MAWEQVGGVLAPSDGGFGDNFGSGVAMSADGMVMVVGAAYWEGPITDQGGVYTYDWSGSGWVQRGGILTAADAGNGDLFGWGVSLSADGAVLAVGAYKWDGTAADQGGVYVYDWSGSAWVQRGGVLVASDAGASDYFGRAVALSATGATLVVGAPDWDALASQGGVYVYDWSGSAWVQRGGVLVASDAGVGDSFGSAVAVSADGAILTVSALLWDGPVADQGGVYTYDWSGSAWVQRGGVLVASDAAGSDYFGYGVALSADGATLVVGASMWEGSLSNQGGVYVYDWSGSEWVQRGEVLTADPDSASGAYFGWAVSLSADGALLAVGATWRASIGRVYTFSSPIPVLSVFWTNFYGQREE